MYVLITGALGHIGSRLITEFLKKGNLTRLYILDNLATQRYVSLRGVIADPRVVFIQNDCRELGDSWDISLPKGSVCIHLAAITDATASIQNREWVMEHNFTVTAQIGKWCKTKGLRLIFASSTSVYGSSGELVDESSDNLFLNPQSPYAESKIREENELKRIFGKQTSYLILRLGTIYGPSHGMRFHTAVNKFIFQYLNGDPLTIWRTAIDQQRPYLYLLDVVSNLIKLVEMQSWSYRTVNLVTENASVRQVLDAIESNGIVKLPVSVQYVDHEIMNQLSYDVSNLRSLELGLSYQGSIKRGVEETVRFLADIEA